MKRDRNAVLWRLVSDWIRGESEAWLGLSASPVREARVSIPFPFKLNLHMIVVTVFLSISWTKWNSICAQNRNENCHHDHIPFNVKGNGNIVFSVYMYLLKRYRVSDWHPVPNTVNRDRAQPGQRDYGWDMSMVQSTWGFVGHFSCRFFSVHTEKSFFEILLNRTEIRL